MKKTTKMFGLVALILPILAVGTGPRKFGPNGCVHVTQSAVGSCVLTTDCAHLDLSKTEFAFDCVSQDGIVRHSYGFGGFEPHEMFDTEVKCGLCEKPTPVKEGIPAPRSMQEASNGVPSAGIRARAHEKSENESPQPVMEVSPTAVSSAPGSSAPAALKPPSGEMALHPGKAPLEHPIPHKDAPPTSFPPQVAQAAPRPKFHKQPPRTHKQSARSLQVAPGLASGGNVDEDSQTEPPSTAEAQPVQFKGQLRAKRQQQGSPSNATAGTWPFDGIKFPWSWETSKGPEVAKYGPEECVSTYRNRVGHCVVQTDCKGVDITDFQFGLLCVDKNGKQVRHLFGKNSFDPEETFDTLIVCEKCLGLEETIYTKIETMSKDIAEIGKAVKDMSLSVQNLNNAVFPQAPAPAPMPTSPAAAAAASASSASLLAQRHQLKHRQEPADDEPMDSDGDLKDPEWQRKAQAFDEASERAATIAQQKTFAGKEFDSDEESESEEEQQQSQKEEQEAQRRHQEESQGAEYDDEREDTPGPDKKEEEGHEKVIHMDDEGEEEEGSLY